MCTTNLAGEVWYRLSTHSAFRVAFHICPYTLSKHHGLCETIRYRGNLQEAANSSLVSRHVSKSLFEPGYPDDILLMPNEP